jgi:PAS domain S-box-containing protein
MNASPQAEFQTESDTDRLERRWASRPVRVLAFPGNEERILILATAGRDTELTDSLANAGVRADVCVNMFDLGLRVEGGCGAIVIAEEGLNPAAAETLAKLLSKQPSWSDIPVIVITRGGEMTQENLRQLTGFGPGGNVMLLERPFRPFTLANTAQVALRSRRRQYQVRDLLEERETVLLSINDSFVTLDRELNYTYVNDNAAEMAQMTRDKMLNRNFWELHPQYIGTAVQDELNRALTLQRIVHFEHFVKPLNRWLDVRIYPSAHGLSILSTDVTERKQAEHRVQEQARQQRQLYDLVDRINRTESLTEVFDAALDSIVSALHADRVSILLFDKNGVMRFRAWRGLSDGYRRATEGHSPWKPAEMDPQPVWINNVEDAEFDEPLRQVIQREGIHSMAFIPLVYQGTLLGKFMVYYNTIHTFSPEELQLAQTISHQLAFGAERRRSDRALHEAQQEIRRHATHLEREVAERTAQLTDTNEQLEAFVYSIAHDLRAPLRSMQAFSSILLDQYAAALDETARNYTRRIVRSAEQMDALILDLLAYGRVARVEMSFTTVPVQSAWNAALAQNERTIEETHAKIETLGPLPAVRAHESTLGQILANLLSNALKFVAADTTPSVVFRAQEKPGWIRLWIEDNGIGIAQDHWERIFRVFERLHGTAYAGTGIGLSIVRKGVERMGGRLGLESVPGQGSKFWVELPAA